MATITTGILGGGLRGKVGGAVFQQTTHGTVVRDLVIPRDPQTPAQRAFRDRQTRAARAWSDLEPTVVALWEIYAKSVGMRPMNAFTTLYGRLLRLDPTTPVPLTPPDRAFFGDIVAISVSPLGESPETLSPLPSGPLLQDESLGGGGVGFVSSGPNAPGIVTELLLQPLASRNRRTYLEKYRTQAFVAYPSAGSYEVLCEAGWVAAAYRFVSSVTGQASPLAELGIVGAG